MGGLDKEPGGNVHKLERNERSVGDRVTIKPDQLEKYVRDAQVPEEEIAAWREKGGDVVVRASKDGTMTEEHGEFLDHNPHPKAQLVSAKQLFIVEKMPGKYRLAPFLGSKKSVWVDVGDVEDNPMYIK